MYANRSIFVQEAAASSYVNTADTKLNGKKLPQSPKPTEFDMTLTFSELKYLFECGYQFKIRFLYGFESPIAEAMGYGRGLHDALSEIHKKAIEGQLLTETDAEALVDRHLWTPFANETIRANLRNSAIEAVKRYFRNYGADLARTIHSEKRIQVHLGDGLTVDGRIDLIRKLDTDEVAIVDFKSKESAQTETLTTDQLQVYALGYKELTGEPADVLEILNLDENGKNIRIGVSDELLVKTFEKVRTAGLQIKNNQLAKHKDWCSACSSCDFAGLCRTRK